MCRVNRYPYRSATMTHDPRDYQNIAAGLAVYESHYWSARLAGLVGECDTDLSNIAAEATKLSHIFAAIAAEAVRAQNN